MNRMLLSLPVDLIDRVTEFGEDNGILYQTVLGRVLECFLTDGVCLKAANSKSHYLGKKGSIPIWKCEKKMVNIGLRDNDDLTKLMTMASIIDADCRKNYETLISKAAVICFRIMVEREKLEPMLCKLKRQLDGLEENKYDKKQAQIRKDLLRVLSD